MEEDSDRDEKSPVSADDRMDWDSAMGKGNDTDWELQTEAARQRGAGWRGSQGRG